MSKILKAHTVNIDYENKILIETGSIADFEGDVDAEPSESYEEKAESIVKKANREAERVLERARREAERLASDIETQAQENAMQIKEQAREEGYQDGLSKAVAVGDKIKAEAEKELSDAKIERERLIESIEPQMVGLIVNISSKLLNNAAQINPDVILNLIKQGLSGATITGDVFIRVSQYEFEHVAENKDTLLALTDGSVHMEIIRDLSLDSMDCVIETPFGNIDCSLNQQFNSLKDNMLYILQQSD